jgi:hypothetical protein
MAAHKIGDLIALQPPKGGDPAIYSLEWDERAQAFRLKWIGLEAAQTLAPQRLAEALGTARPKAA